MFLVLAVIAIIILLLILMRSRKTSSGGGGGGYTVYGTMGCGWTRKQLDYFKDAGMSFTFVDCDSEDCPEMDAFPTTVDASGEETVGFKEF
tara:strand:+ start:2647 stop:2919 length:273 start_codon:yes stop_codon:yes gene_type:complete